MWNFVRRWIINTASANAVRRVDSLLPLVWEGLCSLLKLRRERNELTDRKGCHSQGIGVTSVHSNTVRSHATGSPFSAQNERMIRSHVPAGMSSLSILLMDCNKCSALTMCYEFVSKPEPSLHTYRFKQSGIHIICWVMFPVSNWNLEIMSMKVFLKKLIFDNQIKEFTDPLLWNPKDY
jgi:hypothetical protein